MRCTESILHLGIGTEPKIWAATATSDAVRYVGVYDDTPHPDGTVVRGGYYGTLADVLAHLDALKAAAVAAVCQAGGGESRPPDSPPRGPSPTFTAAERPAA